MSHPSTRPSDLDPSNSLWPVTRVQQAHGHFCLLGQELDAQSTNLHHRRRDRPGSPSLARGPVQVPRLIEPLHEGVRHQGWIRLPCRRRLPLPTGRRSASGLSASSQDAHHGLLLEQRELIRHAFLLLHACRVFRSVSHYPGVVRPFPVVPSPLPGPLLTFPCPSNTIADAVVRPVRDPRRIRPAASPCGRRPSIRCLFVGGAILRLQLPADPAPRRAPLPSAGLSGSVPPLPMRDAHYRHRSCSAHEKTGPPLNTGTPDSGPERPQSIHALQSTLGLSRRFRNAKPCLMTDEAGDRSATIVEV